MKTKTHYLFITLLACFPLVAHSQLYKCKQTDGSTVFQDVDCPQGATSTKIRSTESSAPEVMTLNQNSRGHYYTTLAINGVTVEGVIDTGASMVTISAATANSMQISSNGSQAANIQTANGIMTTFLKHVPVIKVGKFELYNVEVCIARNSPTLIGMSALSHFKISQENGQMVLSKK